MTAPHAIAPEVRTEIDHRLATLASEESVRLLLAVESGSRAWGFPSPDSDYDVRFIYVRPRRDYLALKTQRDVIERPIVDEIDLLTVADPQLGEGDSVLVQKVETESTGRVIR